MISFSGQVRSVDHRSKASAAERRSVSTALAAAVETRDVGTGAHSARVTALAIELLKRTYPSAAREPTVKYGFLLHDIGKIAVPDAILLKPAPLTDAEWKIMKDHPVLGAAILSHAPCLAKAMPIVRHHHERWDGAGYPDGLAGRQIPEPCRAFAVVDAFDAMTSDRPYRRGMSVEKALEEIWTLRGTQFDPRAVQVFIDMMGASHDSAPESGHAAPVSGVISQSAARSPAPREASARC